MASTVLEHIQRQPGVVRPTILMLSSRSRRGDIARSRELGAAAYLIKPIKPSELLNAIMTALPHSLERERAAGGNAVGNRPCRRSSLLRILVAEDNAINRLVAVRILQKAGHSVEVAVNGQEAIDLLARVAFDLILMDVQMPLMDGFEATARIREKEKGTGQHMPIVAMTAHAMKGDRERCLEAGMDGYVAKPIQEKELFAAIAAAVAVTRQPKQDATPRPTVEEAGDGATTLDPLEDEQAFQRELAGMFLEDCPKALTKIREAVAGRDGAALEAGRPHAQGVRRGFSRYTGHRRGVPYGNDRPRSRMGAGGSGRRRSGGRNGPAHRDLDGVHRRRRLPAVRGILEQRHHGPRPGGRRWAFKLTTKGPCLCRNRFDCF